jgi:dUTP pyrophosphatase
MKIFKTRDVKDPNRAHSNDAGFDLFIPNDFLPQVLNPGQSVLIPSGIKARVPEGYALIAFNKSGVAAKKNLIVGASVIDESYQGEIHIDIKNVGNTPQVLSPGDKIIQLLCIKMNYVPIEIASTEDELFSDMKSERGTGGFGSTGTK